MQRRNHRPNASVRRGFTLIELLVAGIIGALLLGSISMTLANLGRSKASSSERLKAYLRADTALNTVRRDIASIIRADDLFYTRLLLSDSKVKLDGEEIDRDELLIFTNRLKPLRDISYKGEGIEYETQFRIQEDEYGPVLWTRRDAFPDQYPAGGGMVQPMVEGIVGLSIEAYNGDDWLSEWDSDEDGLPLAVRVTVTARGSDDWEDFDDAPNAVLRTVVSIDRILLPKDRFLEEEALLLEELEAERAEQQGGSIANDDPSTNGALGNETGPPPDISDINIPSGPGSDSGRGGNNTGRGGSGDLGNRGINNSGEN